MPSSPLTHSMPRPSTVLHSAFIHKTSMESRAYFSVHSGTQANQGPRMQGGTLPGFSTFLCRQELNGGEQKVWSLLEQLGMQCTLLLLFTLLCSQTWGRVRDGKRMAFCMPLHPSTASARCAHLLLQHPPYGSACIYSWIGTNMPLDRCFVLTSIHLECLGHLCGAGTRIKTTEFILERSAII